MGIAACERVLLLDLGLEGMLNVDSLDLQGEGEVDLEEDLGVLLLLLLLRPAEEERRWPLLL